MSLVQSDWHSQEGSGWSQDDIRVQKHACAIPVKRFLRPWGPKWPLSWTSMFQSGNTGGCCVSPTVGKMVFYCVSPGKHTGYSKWCPQESCGEAVSSEDEVC